jgi:hypothetical protein
MPPQDPTPLGDAMTHRFPEQTIPQPKPEATEHQDAREEPEPDIAQRPEIPDEGVHPPGRQRG